MSVQLHSIHQFLRVFTESRLNYPGSMPNYLRLLKRQAREECRESQFMLGLHYKVGLGVKTSRRREKYWLNEAAAMGCTNAQQFLAGKMATTIESSFLIHEYKSDLNDTAIMCGLGIYYELSQGPTYPHDPTKALHWFQSAATGKSDHPHAHYKLAQAYEFGRGIDKDNARAFTLYERSAELGHAQACLRLAQILEHVDGRGTNPDQAFIYLKCGSQSGDAMCQYELGLCYATGRLGLKVDWETAVAWFRRALKGGSPYAAFELGKCIFHGKGTLKNPRTARKLIEQVYAEYPDLDDIGAFWKSHMLWKY